MRAGLFENKLEIRSLYWNYKHPHLDVVRDFANFVCDFRKENEKMFEKCVLTLPGIQEDRCS
jgi:hypothetical protein